MKNFIEKIFVVVLLMVSFLATSCKDTSALKEPAEAAGKKCPFMLDGNLGTIIDIKYENGDVVCYWAMENASVTLDQVKAMPNTIKNCLIMVLASDSNTRKLVEQIVSVGGDVVYRVKTGADYYDLEQSSSEVKTALNDGNGQDAKGNGNVQFAKSADIHEMVAFVNNNISKDIDGAMCTIEDKNVVFTIPAERVGFELDKFRESSEGIKESILKKMTPNNDPTYEACVVNGYNLVYRYIDSDDKVEILITPEEIKKQLGM